jgi:hypothetical protein
MKINNKLNQIKVSKIYYFDMENMLSSIHNGTKTVKVLNLYQRNNSNPLAEVQSIETKEIFNVDIGHLQLNPEYLKLKYYKLMHYYKKNNPKMIFKHTSEIFDKTKKYIIIGNEPEVNCLRMLDKDGIVHSFGYGWFENLNLKRNEDYDREQEEQMRELADDFYDYSEEEESISKSEEDMISVYNDNDYFMLPKEYLYAEY